MLNNFGSFGLSNLKIFYVTGSIVLHQHTVPAILAVHSVHIPDAAGHIFYNGTIENYRREDVFSVPLFTLLQLTHSCVVITRE